MLQQSTIQFLKDLKKNNNKPWFDVNRKKYELAKEDFLLLVEKTITTIANFDKSIENLEAKKCVFRINRDVRFSKDKSPYKTNMGATFSKGGKKIERGGYYFHLEPGGSFVAGGLYMPSPEDLQKIRQEIDYNFDDWKKIVTNKKFKTLFPKGVDGVETLARPPKGYDANNPAIEYLKMKSFIVSTPIADKELTDKKLLKTMETAYKAMKPMVDFLNAAVE